MNVEISTVGTKNSLQPERQKALNLVQSCQSLTTVRQEPSNLPAGIEPEKVPSTLFLSSVTQVPSGGLPRLFFLPHLNLGDSF